MNKTALALGVVSILTYSIPTMPVKALNTDVVQPYADEIQPRTVGLIRNYDLYISNSDGNLCLGGYTISSNQMKSIGLTDIEVQRSTDNVNWSKEKGLSDMLASSAYSKYISDYTTSVTGGYYYRVSCKHYAKESGLFGSSQSVSNTSNSVWIN